MDVTDVLSRYGSLVDDFEGFVAACQRPLPAVVRVNTLKATVDRVREALAADGVATEPGWRATVLRLDTDRPGNTWPYIHGWIHGQEEASIIPAVVLDPAPGERVLDACAAPGSKTTQLAALMDDRGTLVANDVTLGRLSALRSNAERCGVTNAIVTNQDARSYPLGPVGDSAFDRVLVDAPCSCEGTVRKNPAALEGWSETRLASLADVQAAILSRAVGMTRPGGTVVYATCTFAPEENEAVLDTVINEAPCRPVAYELDLETRPGIPEWRDRTFDPRVEHAKRIYPHLTDTGGFFCAKLEVGG